MNVNTALFRLTLFYSNFEKNIFWGYSKWYKNEMEHTKGLSSKFSDWEVETTWNLQNIAWRVGEMRVFVKKCLLVYSVWLRFMAHQPW